MTPDNPYDMFSLASQRNPDLHDRMRLEDPVHCAIHPVSGQRVWFLTRYDDCQAFLKDKRFGRNVQKLPAHLRHSGDDTYSADTINQHMLNLDDPDHSRLRAVVQTAFMPKRIQKLSPRLQAIADSLFDNIDATVADGDELDLTQLYISQFPLLTIAELLGISSEDYPNLFLWTHQMLAEDDLTVRQGITALTDYLYRQIDLRKQQPIPLDDVLSGLIFSESEGLRLNRDELLAMVYLFITAGYETMVNFISNSVMTLLEYPDVLRQLQNNLDNPAMIQTAIDELLRFAGPSHITLEQWAYQDVTIRDKVIKQGDIVHAVLFAANRDPQIFKNPHELDILRKPNKHIAFSHGIHHCLGAALARLEGDIAIMTLLRRMPNL